MSDALRAAPDKTDFALNALARSAIGKHASQRWRSERLLEIARKRSIEKRCEVEALNFG